MFRSILRKPLERISAQGVLPTLAYYGGTVALERVGLHTNAVYRMWKPTVALSANVTCTRALSIDSLSQDDRTLLEGYGGAALLFDFEQAFARSESCVVAYKSGELGCVCWITESQTFAAFPGQPSVLIQRCFTLPAQRGQGLYAQALSYATRMLIEEMPSRPVLIESSVWNRASVRGIEHAGFLRIGYRIEWKTQERYLPWKVKG